MSFGAEFIGVDTLGDVDVDLVDPDLVDLFRYFSGSLVKEGLLSVLGLLLLLARLACPRACLCRIWR